MPVQNIWKAGDIAEYVAGPPWWRDYKGQKVKVIHVGESVHNPGHQVATIERLDTGKRTAVSAGPNHTNIKPIGGE